MSQSFPTSVPSNPDTAGSETLNAAGAGKGLSGILDDYGLDISAIATKVGTGASTPGNGKVLKSDSSGTSLWAAVDLTGDVTGALPVANGGTGQANLTNLTFTTPTLTTPVIASFASANHDHTNSAGGGVLTGSALTSTDGLLRTVHYYTYDGTDIFIDGVDQNNAANTTTWNKPTGLKYAIIEVQAGGGAGGGTPATSGTQYACGAGGGAGAYARSKLANADMTSSVTITVGAGGTGGTGTGGTGGNSSFGSYVTANGGLGGTSTGATSNATGNGCNGGATMATATGDLIIAGGAGHVASTLTPHNNVAFGGNGGNSALGRGGQGRFANTTGVAGAGYGSGGGGGARSVSQGATNGGNGASGIVIVYEYF